MKFKVSIPLTLVGFCIMMQATAQSIDLEKKDVRVDINFEYTRPVSEIIDYLEDSYGLKFFYKEEWLKEIRIHSIKLTNVLLIEALGVLFENTKLIFIIPDDTYIFLINTSFLHSVNSTSNKSIIELKGRVLVANSKEPAKYVTVFVEDLKKGVATDENGYYSIKISSGTHSISFKSIEFLEEKYKVNINNSNKTLNIELFKKNRQLEEVIVSSGALSKSLTSIDVGKVQLNTEVFRKLPSFLGEIDITRVVKSLPGVQSVGEGSADFNVRGGDKDQNLILLDGIPIYNSSHLLGFFSVYNPDLVNDFTLYKGSMPANYGGRLSSVLEVVLKKPDFKNFGLKGGIGPVSNRLSFNIPINNKNAFIIAGRYSNPTWILNLVKDKNIQASSASYYDVNIKYLYKPSDRSILDLSIYNSKDNIYLGGANIEFKYQNLGASLKYVNALSEKLSYQIKLSFIDYKASSLNERKIGFESLFKTGVRDFGAYFDIESEVSTKTTINTGFETIFSQYIIGNTFPACQSSGLEEVLVPQEQSLENAVFFKLETSLLQKFKVGLGLRYSFFNNIGPTDEYVYDVNRPKSETSIIDTLKSASGEFVRLFSGVEPRLSATYQLRENLSLKFSYSRTRQYKYLFSNSVASLPVDVWKPADNNIPIQIADQVSLGVVSKFSGDKYDLSMDFFYKNLPGTALLKIGAQAINNPLLSADIVSAEGRAYGVETLFRKVRGNFTGFFSYTYSISKARIINDFTALRLDKSNFFRSNFDSPHNLSLSISIKMNKLLTFTSNFVYISGRPVTVPTSSFVTDNVRVFSTTKRNNFRIPDTHRLDLAMTLEGSYKKNRKWQSSWTLSIYNVYGRENPFSVYIKAENNTSPRLVKLSILGNVFPSVSYNFKLLPAKH